MKSGLWGLSLAIVNFHICMHCAWLRCKNGFSQVGDCHVRMWKVKTFCPLFCLLSLIHNCCPPFFFFLFSTLVTAVVVQWKVEVIDISKYRWRSKLHRLSSDIIPLEVWILYRFSLWIPTVIYQKGRPHSDWVLTIRLYFYFFTHVTALHIAMPADSCACTRNAHGISDGYAVTTTAASKVSWNGIKAEQL